MAIKRILKSLPIQMVIPVVVAIGLVGIGLYFFVLRSVSEFADEQIKKELSTIASEVYNICDENFTELMQAGKMDNRKAIVIKKALTIGSIEEYTQKNNIDYRLIDAEKGNLLQSQIDPKLLSFIIKYHSKGISSTFQFKGKTYYFQHFDFKPWGWHFGLVKDTKEYASLIGRVKLAYIVTGILLLLGLALILFLQERFLRRPLTQIISALRSGQPPKYKGVYELEFLSNSISEMMSSLAEKNKWVEHSYQIAIMNRGEEFFKLVATALSEALSLNTLILSYNQEENDLHIIAFSQVSLGSSVFCDSHLGLPNLRIIAEKKAIVISSGAHLQFPSAQCLSAIKADSYAGVPILNREGMVIGTINLFGEERCFDEWDLHLIETVCQIVAVEFEYLAKESDKAKLEIQLQQAKKMEVIGLLAGGVAHDLNNVLSGIVSYPDLLLMEIEENSPLRKPILTMQSSGRKAAEIVKDLLTLARRGVKDKSIINLNDIILEYLQSPENKILTSYHPSVSVETQLDKKLLNIEGSATQLIKVLMNLISNAAEAQPSGGKTTISTRNQYIDTPIKGYEEIHEGDFAVLEVTDQGFGIATEDLTRIFEPFYSKKTMGRSGTGLGMAVVWGAVHDHDGFIDVKSTEGIGTTFSLYFPISREGKVRRNELIPIEEYIGSRETILIVDDVKEQRDIGASILEKLNYRVKTVSSGEDAIIYLQNNHVDLLILDMIMEPGIDGLETYRRIKKLHPFQKALIVSGFSETERVQEVQSLGAGDYVKKPYTMENIGLAVKKELKRGLLSEL